MKEWKLFNWFSKNRFVTTKDFQKEKPQHPATKYSSFEPVTRDNFAALLIKSFAVSEGEFSRQKIYSEWLKIKIGFNWEKTLRNFIRAGG